MEGGAPMTGQIARRVIEALGLVKNVRLTEESVRNLRDAAR
jgi:hypothetical protein